jgi:REP element-mobilizing transposase RayT
MIYEEGNYYHLYNRGCNKDLIFYDEFDFQKLIKIIKESATQEYLELYAFALMPNHYHFLVKQISDKPISNWIKYIFIKYAKYFNKKYERKGTIFEGKVKVKIIDKIEFLGFLTHYIHNNPNSELLVKYSSLSFLEENTFINLAFYEEYFNSIENYFIQFERYKKMKNNKLLEDYVF